MVDEIIRIKFGYFGKLSYICTLNFSDGNETISIYGDNTPDDAPEYMARWMRIDGKIR